MTLADIGFRIAVTLIVVPVFTFCWVRGAVMIARDRFRSRSPASGYVTT